MCSVFLSANSGHPRTTANIFYITSTLRQVVGSSQRYTSLINKTAQRHNLEDNNSHSERCEHLPYCVSPLKRTFKYLQFFVDITHPKTQSVIQGVQEKK